jgi:transposase
VVQDNLRIHYANALQGIYTMNFVRHMLPTYSCALNPIETLWSLIKRKWRQNLFHITEYLSKVHDQKYIGQRAMERLRDLIGRSTLLL